MMSETKPISFRVARDVLDAIEADGKSATEIARAALEREARLVLARKALAHMRAHPLVGSFEGDVVDFIRKDRDSR
jgi:hypothetical protein